MSLGLVLPGVPSLSALVAAVGIVFAVKFEFIIRIIIIADAGKLNPIQRSRPAWGRERRACGDQKSCRQQ
jgi:hypothetical protein